MTTALTAPGFANDPLVSHSGQFPLGAPFDRASMDIPSDPTVRPWALRGMTAGETAHTSRTIRYDHMRQVSVDESGRPLIEAGPPTVKNKTNLDGDEGPSEDFSYDFVPDEPSPV